MALVIICASAAKAQRPPQLAAEKIATKMKDTLSLTTGQRTDLYTISMNIEIQKQLTLQQYTGTDSLLVKLKYIEYLRDSLYRPVLTTEQFNQYKLKRMELVFRH